MSVQLPTDPEPRTLYNTSETSSFMTVRSAMAFGMTWQAAGSGAAAQYWHGVASKQRSKTFDARDRQQRPVAHFGKKVHAQPTASGAQLLSVQVYHASVAGVGRLKKLTSGTTVRVRGEGQMR